jgi:WD40 repeat protein
MNKLKVVDNDIDSQRSIGPNGRNVFEDALKLRINSRHIVPIRIINTCNNCWVNNVQITKAYYPIQVIKDRYEELRYRLIGISTGSSSNISVFDCEYGNIIYSITGYTCRITSLSLSIPQIGKNLVPLFVTGDNDGYIRTYDLQSGVLLTPNLADYKHPGPITTLFINERLKSYIFAGVESSVYVWKINSEKLETTINDHTASVKCISACTQRSYEDINFSVVCTAGHDGFVYGYDIQTLEKIFTLEIGLLINTIDVKFISCIEVCLVLGTFEGIVQVYELTQNKCLQNLKCSDRSIQAIVIIDTKVPAFICAGADAVIKLYDLREGIHLITLYGCHVDCIRSIDVTIEPRLIIVSGGYDNKTIVYDLHKMADNDSNMKLLLKHLQLKPFHFESKKVYLFENSIDDDNSSVITTEVSQYLINKIEDH